MYKQLLKFVLIFLLSSSLSISSDLSIEGQSDWTMFQYNAQHTGYNDKDSIAVPLQLLWTKRYFEVITAFEPITAVGDRLIITNERTHPIYDTIIDPTIRCVDINNGDILWQKKHLYTEVGDLDQASYYNGNLYILETDYYRDSTRIAEYDFETGNLQAWFLFYSQGNDQLGSIIYDDKLLFPAGTYNGIECASLITYEYLWGTHPYLRLTFGHLLLMIQ